MKLHFSGWLLGAALILSACGGGSSTTDAVVKSSASASEISPEQAAAETLRKRFHDTDAFVFLPDPVQKLAAIDPGIRKIASKQKVGSALEQSAKIDLGSVPSSELSLRDQNNQKNAVNGGGKAYQISVNRTIAVTAFAKSFSSMLTWSTQPNGNSLGTTSFSSTGAAGIRLGLLITSLPDNALVRTSGSDDSSTLEITGAYINQAVAANVSADGSSDNARTYWLPMTSGAMSTLAIELPAGIAVNNVLIAVPSLSHALQMAPQAAIAALSPKSDCPGINPDATCSVPLPPVANAVATYDFLKNGIGYVCNGTLIADKSLSGTPYFLTANHCVSDQTTATTMTSHWFYRSSACNSGLVNPGTVDTYGGATLRYTKSSVTGIIRNPVGTDTTLVSLNAAPPSGVMFVGWTNNQQAVNPAVSLAALHNPLGSVLRQSTGAITSMSFINAAGNAYIATSLDKSTAYPMYVVNWSSGIVEKGSSGSGLFLDGATSNPKIVGQLSGGSSSCTAPTEPDAYGRFDIAYQDGMINWLNPGYRMVFRFYNTINSTHFYSADINERNQVRSTLSHLTYEGPAFSVAPAATTGLSPVYRFFNAQTGAHFYTISESEKLSVQANLPAYQLEGIAWYARTSSDATTGTIPVFRFYQKIRGTHFYTVSPEERDSVIAKLSSTYSYEGVAYYAWTAN